MRTSVTLGDELLKQFSNQIGALSKSEGHKALARAVNRTTTTAHVKVARIVAKQSSIPLKIVKGQIKRTQVRPGYGGELEGHIIATGNPIPLKEFRPTQFTFGVRVKVWGKRQTFKGMFIYAGSFRSGKYVGAGNVFQRVTSKSLPIAKQYGPAVPSEMIKEAVTSEFSNIVYANLPNRIRHELSRMMPLNQ